MANTSTIKSQEIHTQKINWGGRTLSLETGKIARQADGAVLARYGDTTVLCTVVGAKKAKDDVDFFPLSVHYQEKAFAVGKIPGGFFKREGKPSENEVLTSRLIDRPIRPLFAEHFFNEVQIICTVLSYDHENSTDVVAMIGAFAAVAVSGLPCEGPLAAAKVGFINGDFVLNPTLEKMKESKLDLVVAGTAEGVLMVESEADELSEDTMLKAVTFGHENLKPVLEMIKKLKKAAGKKDWETPKAPDASEELYKHIKKHAEKKLKDAYKTPVKQERYKKIDEAYDATKELMGDFLTEKNITDNLFDSQFEKLKSTIMRGNILKGARVDGRDLTTIRPITCEVGILPLTHGSALFTRGETQALVVSTLGTTQDEQIMDCLEGEYRENFMLHYNFPPYSVGETGRVSSPGRREIGHGRLAWRALHPLVPSKDAFPYTTRTVSEVTESNGSSSMATVCGASLALMNAGVPLKSHVAGIAMGLVKEGKNHAVLSDILGDEDHLGDMDFKVAGTENGITALQMDIKITSITPEIMSEALDQAHGGRMHILSKLKEAIAGPSSVSSNAPRMTSMTISPDKIREVIGAGGKVIKEITAESGARINVEDTGIINISGDNQEQLQKAIDMITEIVGNGATQEPEIGAIYEGKVVNVKDFGVFVRYLGRREGMVHVSEIPSGQNLKVDDVVRVKYMETSIGRDKKRKDRLSIKAALDN